MLKQPEFSDLNFTRHVMEVVEEEDLMAEMGQLGRTVKNLQEAITPLEDIFVKLVKDQENCHVEDGSLT
jgi:hypothetical protein